MIALVRINTDKNVPPLGLLYVGGALKKAGFDVKIFHITPDEIEKYSKKIADMEPLFVGFSVMTGNQTKDSADMSKQIKSMSDTTTVWGGVHPSMLPEQCASEEYIDTVVIGDGEKTTVRLAETLKKGGRLSEIRGVAFKNKDGKVVSTGLSEQIMKLDDYRMDWNLIDVREYTRPNTVWGCKKVIAYVSSRGCPYNCGFCYNLTFHRRRWRSHSVDYVVSDVQFLKDTFGIDGIMFLDDTFWINTERGFEIINSIKLPWRGDIRANLVNRSFVEKIKKTEPKKILIGMESGSERLLRLMDKEITIKDIVRTTKLIATIPDIQPFYSFIIALPTETWKETQMTIDLVLKLHDIDPRILYSVGNFIPYPGTPLFDLAVKLGFKPPNRTEDWNVVERWEGKLELSWVPWADKRKFNLIRNYCKYLNFQTNYKIPLISKLARYRLAKRNFSFPIDERIMEWVLAKVIPKTGGCIGRLLWRGEEAG